MFYVSFQCGSKRKKNTQKKKRHFERSSCFRPFFRNDFPGEAPPTRGRSVFQKILLLLLQMAATILQHIERLLLQTRDQIYTLAQNRQEWYRETERLCRLLRGELQTDPWTHGLLLISTGLMISSRLPPLVTWYSPETWSPKLRLSVQCYAGRYVGIIVSKLRFFFLSPEFENDFFFFSE